MAKITPCGLNIKTKAVELQQGRCRGAERIRCLQAPVGPAWAPLGAEGHILGRPSPLPSRGKGTGQSQKLSRGRVWFWETKEDGLNQEPTLQFSSVCCREMFNHCLSSEVLTLMQIDVFVYIHKSDQTETMKRCGNFAHSPGSVARVMDVFAEWDSSFWILEE